NRAGQYRIAGEAYPDGVTTGIAARALGSKVALVASGTLEESLLDGRFVMATQALDVAGRGAIDLAGNSVDDVAIKAALRDPGLLGEGVVLSDA
ncbi:MAG: hypothetical protein KJZ64_15935, partial [Sphingomonadaceae bacterium]|nr:hypothetical protein [Sphingomonadaceae bacterium]